MNGRGTWTASFAGAHDHPRESKRPGRAPGAAAPRVGCRRDPQRCERSPDAPSPKGPSRAAAAVEIATVWPRLGTVVDDGHDPHGGDRCRRATASVAALAGPGPGVLPGVRRPGRPRRGLEVHRGLRDPPPAVCRGHDHRRRAAVARPAPEDRARQPDDGRRPGRAAGARCPARHGSLVLRREGPDLDRHRARSRSRRRCPGAGRSPAPVRPPDQRGRETPVAGPGAGPRAAPVRARGSEYRRARGTGRGPGSPRGLPEGAWWIQDPDDARHLVAGGRLADPRRGAELRTRGDPDETPGDEQGGRRRCIRPGSPH